MQQSPSNKLYAQAADKLKSLIKQYSSTKTRSADVIGKEVNDTLEDLSENLGAPTVKYRELQFGEIPNSFTMNEFLESLAHDINVMLDEMNIVKAGSIQTHNFIKTEILKSQQQNDRLHNKIKALQLYSSSEDGSILYVGDHFYNDDQIDWDLTDPTSRINLTKGNNISLGILSQEVLIDNVSKVSIENGSNGFIGNNQEVYPNSDPTSVRFLSENVQETPQQSLKKLLDQEPNTYFEFEKYYIQESVRNQAKNFNFDYKIAISPGINYLNQFGQSGDRVSWANGLNGQPLRLNLLIDIGSIKKMNVLSFDPYGLTDNKNAPLLIRNVIISSDQNNWIKLSPQNVWVTNGIDQNSVNLDGDNIVIGTAYFQADGLDCRFIKMEIEQSLGRTVPIGHMYYVDPNDTAATRTEGPIPTVTRIWQEKEPGLSYQNNVVQRREVLSGTRWAIGIRDITALGNKYAETSVMISKRLDIPGGVDRVSIEAEVEIPENFATDTAWIRFYISPDDGTTWHQISRIQDDYLGIPEVIAYNDNTPAEMRIPGTSYYETIKTPNSLRVKIEIDRPTGNDSITPLVKSYRLKVKQRVTS